MNKSILVDVERLKYPRTGLANVCFSLIKGLIEQQSDLTYTFYGPQKNLPAELPVNQSLYWKLWQKHFPVRTSAYSLIHVTHQLSEYFWHVNPSQKKVVTLHDLNFLHDQSSTHKVAKSIKLVQRNLEAADAVICISEFVKKDFLQHQSLFKLKDNVRVEVIYNGLIFPEDQTAVINGVFDTPQNPYILTIGVLFPKKNQHVLLNLIAETGRDLVLVTSSAKSAYKERFLKEIKDKNLENRVHIRDNVSDVEKFCLLQNCEAYVHPSLAEGFGIPPVEAMFFGKPVFLSKATSLPEIGGEVAFYFDDFSAEDMCRVYEHGIHTYNENVVLYQEKLRKRAALFSYRTMAQSYEQLYRELLS